LGLPVSWEFAQKDDVDSSGPALAEQAPVWLTGDNPTQTTTAYSLTHTLVIAC
jgi:hypothetical protein